MEFRLDPGQVELQQTVDRFCADRFPLEGLVGREGAPVDLTVWSEQYYRAPFSITLKIAFGARRVRCEACRHNFASFRAVKSTRERLQSWKSELDLVEQTLGASSTPAQKPVDAFVQLTMRNIVASLTDLQHMTQALATQQAAREACQLMNCPRGLALAQALKEAVDTLERTKRAFKSKELGDLRKTLEEVLKAYA